MVRDNNLNVPECEETASEHHEDTCMINPVVHWVERIPLRPSPYRSDQGSIPARGLLLHVFPSISLYNKKDKT